MLKRLLRDNPRAGLLLGLLVAANVASWAWAMAAFNASSTLMAASLLAWCYGLRHAVDADHIAAIDNVTRKMMQQGNTPLSVGTWFSLGHASIVILASVAIAVTTATFQQKIGWLHDVGGVIGTSVSACFLLVMALINLAILRSVWCNFRQLKYGEPLDTKAMEMTGSGIMNRLFHSVFCLIGKSWHMYLVGFLFGLGFDTATEIGMLGLSATSASSGMSVWSILVFPALFTSGMAMIDTLDNMIMVGAYGWAFKKPQRKLYYNMTITGTSVIVALFIGGLEGLSLLSDKFGLKTGIWQWIGTLNDNLGNTGFLIIGVCIACWIISIIHYRWKGYDALLSQPGKG